MQTRPDAALALWQTPPGAVHSSVVQTRPDAAQALVYIQNLNIEAKRSKFILNCESSEANMFDSKKYLFRSEANIFILNNLNIEVKRTDSLVRKFISKRSEHVYIKDIKYRSEAKQVNIKK